MFFCLFVFIFHLKYYDTNNGHIMLLHVMNTKKWNLNDYIIHPLECLFYEKQGYLGRFIVQILVIRIESTIHNLIYDQSGVIDLSIKFTFI